MKFASAMLFLRSKLAMLLALLLLVTSALPAAAATEETSDPGSVDIVSAVNEAAGIQAAAAPPSWTVLGKLSRGFLSLMYAASQRPVSKLSADERYLAYMSYIMQDDTGRTVVQLHDRRTGELLTVKTPDATGWVHHFDMTPDARYVVYSYGESLVSPAVKVYLYDRTTDTLETVNGTSAASGFGSFNANTVSVSANGRYVAFDTAADGLVSGDNDGKRDVYLFDREASGDKLRRISVPLEAGWNDESFDPVISADGGTIAFVSTAKLTDLEDYIGTESLYLYNVAGSALQRITQGYTPALSADGRYMAFTTYRDDLADGDANGQDDIYVYDRTSDSYSRVSRLPNGGEQERNSLYPSISPNGAYVAYETEVTVGTGDDVSEETAVYVADSQGLQNAKLEVPGAAVTLIPSLKRPSVSDSGTVSFYGMSQEDIGGHQIAMPDYFIASTGTMPVWPSGSALQASNAGADQITLGWPTVAGAEGYALYKNGVPVRYVPAGGASPSVTLTGQVRAEGISDLFQVEAIDANYHWTLDGPSYTWEPNDTGGENPPPEDLPLILLWSGDRTDAGGPLKPESAIDLKATGTSGVEAQVELAYKEDVAGTITPKTAAVVLTESAGMKGSFTGSFKLPANATELTDITLKQKRSDGTTAEEKADGLPVPVGGALSVTFAGASKEELAGAILSVYGSQSRNQTVVLGEDGENGDSAVFDGLFPGDDYVVELRTPDYQYEMGRLEGLTVRAGRTTEVSLDVVVPAQVRVLTVDANGAPVANVPVSLYDADRNLLLATTTNADGVTYTHEGLLRGQAVTAELELGNLYYELAPDAVLTKTLAGGVNVLRVPLASPERGTLELTVKDPDGKPLFNAYVSATQTYKGRPVVTNAVTSLDGRVRMELFAGNAVIEATLSSDLYSSGQVNVTVPSGATASLDIPVKRPDTGVVKLEVYKKALDTDWLGPLNLANEAFLTRVESKFGWMSSYYSNAFNVAGGPGTPVSVCVSGAIYAYVSQCKSVTLDEHSNATAEIRLEEKGARVQGKVERRADMYYSAEIYQIKPDGQQSYVDNVWNDSFRTDPFNINVPEGGTYRIEFSRSSEGADYRTRYEYATAEFTIEENQIKNIGTIAFSPSRYFTNKKGNFFSAQSSRVTPGGTLTLRAGYRNTNEETAENAMLVLDIPEGMTVVGDGQGSLAVTGGVGAAVIEGGALRVPVGNLAKDQGGVVTYKLQVSEAYEKQTAAASARIKAKLGTVNVEETLGTAYLDTPRVTLDAPSRLGNPERKTVLSGYAPAGSALVLYDSDVRIGGATANAAGTWEAEVTLIDLGDSGYHALWAEATSNGIALRSDKAYVQYDLNGPELLRMAMAQAPAGKWVMMESGKDANDFVYSVHPGDPFLMDFEFSKPDDVENVRVYLEGQEGEPVTAVRSGDLFRVTVPTTRDALGGIWVDYDVKQPEKEYDGERLDLEQFRASLPVSMRDFEIVSKTDFETVDGVFTGTVVLRFPSLGGKRMSITLKLNPNSTYQPTEAEKALAAKSGVPAIQKRFDIVEQPKSLGITIQGYMPSNLVADTFPVSAGLVSSSRIAAKLGRPAKAGDWGHTAEYFMEIKSDVDEVKDQIDEYKGEFEEQRDNYMGFAGKVNKIMYNVETSGMDCLSELPTTVKQGGKALASLVVGEVAKTALGAWTGAMALTGAPAIIAGYATDVIEDKIDNYVDEQIDAIGTGYNQCNDDSDSDYYTNQMRKRGKKVAKPKWIYDPSGYVYEAVKSNPISDVTATVMMKDPLKGDWKVWNADEYDQVNPQRTDAEGKYGWDVPPGKWKVVWMKDGYETASSAELDVPPPRTEVNAGLVTRAAPRIETVKGYAGESSYVDLTFTRYLEAVELKDEAVTLMDAEGRVLESTLTWIGKEPSAANPDVQLARTIRLTTKQPLTAGGSYTVQANSIYMTSYAGVKMTLADASTPLNFIAEALDTTGPAVASVRLESGGRIIRIAFNEPVASLTEADTAKLALNGQAGFVRSAVAEVNRDGSAPRELLLTLDGEITSAAALTLPAGAVKDLAGNGSVEATVSLAPAGNPRLSGLTVGQYALCSPFNPEVLVYCVKLPTGTKTLTVTPTAADANAALLINGAPAVSGLAQTITIPEDNLVRVTVVLSGAPARTYTIHAEYTSETDGGNTPPDPNPKPPATGGDPLDLTGRALFVRKPNGQGGMSVSVALSKDAIVTALDKAAGNGALRTLFVDVKETADEAALQFPAELAGMLAEAKAVISLRLNGLNVTLDPAAMPTAKPADGAMLRMSIVLTQGLSKEAETSVQLLNREWTLMSFGTASVTVETVSGGSAVPVTFGKKKGIEGVFTGTLDASSAGSMPKVYRYDPATGQWLFAGGAKVAGGKGLQFDMSTPGVYAAIRFQNRFKDTASHWAKPDIDWMSERLLVNGVTPFEFRPENEVTRAEFTAMLTRAIGMKPNHAPSDSVFADVEPGAWYEKDVRTAVALGLVSGVDAKHFAPQRPITREEMALLLSRAYRLLNPEGTEAPDRSVLLEFKDSARIHSWAKDAVALTVQTGLLQGMPNGSFSPDSRATRAQAAAVLARLLKKQEL
ncbi:S-layer homology domain-containing protein [Paenibacillus montanisoli]|uniref:SLH domain-containing protein n=1 Tax=Paenibacillus montanisoli TaxID=2081970 RepID=A0A328TXP7_9BACL|nr:S-layer homology domain-containing protein [Paenibacillus montanisoli]RAP74333.1 hypothetical protein DL346_19805 [Paenibacillus montanisoli]